MIRHYQHFPGGKSIPGAELFAGPLQCANLSLEDFLRIEQEHNERCTPEGWLTATNSEDGHKALACVLCGLCIYCADILWEEASP